MSLIAFAMPLLDAVSAPMIIAFGLAALILLAVVVTAVVLAIILIVRAVKKKKKAQPGSHQQKGETP